MKKRTKRLLNERLFSADPAFRSNLRSRFRRHLADPDATFRRIEPEPTGENLRYPVIARVDLPGDMGAHNLFPMLQMKLPEFAKQKSGSVKDFLLLIGETTPNECRESRQMARIFDITDETKPIGVSTWTVPEDSGNFCSAGGRFGTHSSNESFTPVYYNRVVFIAHFNAGVRALDIRDPYRPKEIGYYIPAITDKTDKRCVGQGAEESCKIAIQRN